ncbi:MAG TPA: hypothetical protein VI589_00465 [Vicinamibacteria bacterium]
MTLRLLVALTGILGTDQAQLARSPGADRPQPAQAQEGLRPAPSTGRMESGFLRLHNPRTGVTCSMLIVPATPSVDAGIFPGAIAPAAPERRAADDIVRNQASPCVE